MSDSAIVVCGNNGCVILICGQEQTSEESSSNDEDPLLQKVIKSKIKAPNQHPQCEIKSFSNQPNMVIVVHGTSDERKKIFEESNNLTRTYLLSSNKTIPMLVLADLLGRFITKMKLKFSMAWDVGVIFVSYSIQNGCELYSIDADGECYKRFGDAIGYCKNVLRKNLSKANLKDFSARQLLEEVTKIAVKSLDDLEDFELSWICEESNGSHQICDGKLVNDIMNKLN